MQNSFTNPKHPLIWEAEKPSFLWEGSSEGAHRSTSWCIHVLKESISIAGKRKAGLQRIWFRFVKSLKLFILVVKVLIRLFMDTMVIHTRISLLLTSLMRRKGPIHISDGGYRGKSENEFLDTVKKMGYNDITDLQDFKQNWGFSVSLSSVFSKSHYLIQSIEMAPLRIARRKTSRCSSLLHSSFTPRWQTS